MEEKSTHSDKIFNTCALLAACAALALYLFWGIAFLIDREVGLTFFLYVFYPLLAADAAAVYLSLAQLCRNRYLSAVLSSVLSLTVLLALIVAVILQGVLLKQVYILPFCFL